MLLTELFIIAPAKGKLSKHSEVGDGLNRIQWECKRPLKIFLRKIFNSNEI